MPNVAIFTNKSKQTCQHAIYVSLKHGDFLNICNKTCDICEIERIIALFIALRAVINCENNRHLY